MLQKHHQPPNTASEPTALKVLRCLKKVWSRFTPVDVMHAMTLMGLGLVYLVLRTSGDVSSVSPTAIAAAEERMDSSAERGNMLPLLE
jgi:hypothetical protein